MASSNSYHAAYIKGDALCKKGRFKEASQFFRIAIEECPEDYQAMWALGNCYTELKKPRKAEDAFRSALTECDNADRMALIYNLANSLFDQKKFAEAIALYSEIPSGHKLSRVAKRNAFLAKERAGV
jgi:tetratricopeptide (TPR) repeat protein